ncbi:MAG TPA: hypothetical protein EYP14_06635 [Planctomycetaceae bacterium]|nr:hypothetical protein [Planctomycetaceae bacterium]
MRDFVPAAGYPSQWRVIIETLNRRQPEGETRLGSCLQTVAERVRKRSLVIVISDLFDDPDRLALGLRHLHSRRHDVSVLQVVDPQEQDFAIEQVTRFKGLEGETEVTANPLAIRRAYRDEFNQFVKRVRRECHERSIDFELVRTDQPLDRALAAFLRGRKERLSWG